MTIEFPVLVYKDGDGYAAECLLTGTLAHSPDELAAVAEVVHLLRVLVEEAMGDAGGDSVAAMRMMASPAPSEMWAQWACAADLGRNPVPAPTGERFFAIPKEVVNGANGTPAPH